MIKKIISGGQTGADQGGLFGARDAGIPTGGFAPDIFLTERGVNPKLLRDEFGLVDSGLDYAGRTRLNAKNSDITIWFGKANTPGFYATRRSAVAENKPFYEARVFTGPVTLADLMEDYEVVNIAGNRESKNPGVFDLTRCQVFRAIETIKAREGMT